MAPKSGNEVHKCSEATRNSLIEAWGKVRLSIFNKKAFIEGGRQLRKGVLANTLRKSVYYLIEQRD